MQRPRFSCNSEAVKAFIIICLLNRLDISSFNYTLWLDILGDHEIQHIESLLWHQEKGEVGMRTRRVETEHDGNRRNTRIPQTSGNRIALPLVKQTSVVAIYQIVYLDFWLRTLHLSTSN